MTERRAADIERRRALALSDRSHVQKGTTSMGMGFFSWIIVGAIAGGWPAR